MVKYDGLNVVKNSWSLFANTVTHVTRSYTVLSAQIFPICALSVQSLQICETASWKIAQQLR